MGLVLKDCDLPIWPFDGGGLLFSGVGSVVNEDSALFLLPFVALANMPRDLLGVLGAPKLLDKFVLRWKIWSTALLHLRRRYERYSLPSGAIPLGASPSNEESLSSNESYPLEILSSSSIAVTVVEAAGGW